MNQCNCEGSYCDTSATRPHKPGECEHVALYAYRLYGQQVSLCEKCLRRAEKHVSSLRREYLGKLEETKLHRRPTKMKDSTKIVEFDSFS